MKRVSLVASVLAAIVVLPLAALSQRSYVSGYFMLDIGGETRVVRSVEGGDVAAPVVEQAGGDQIVRKTIGSSTYDPIEALVPVTAFHKVVRQFLERSATRYQVAIHETDARQTVTATTTGADALITEIGFPAVDAGSKEPAYMKIRLQADRTQRGAAAAARADLTKGDVFSAANFRLEIDGLDCTRVAKIEAITIKQQAAGERYGQTRFEALHAGPLQVSNLVVTLPEAQAQSFVDWHRSFVVQRSTSSEKSGRLTFLSPNRQNELLVLKLEGLGVFRIERNVDDAEGSARRLRVHMYMETVRLE